MSTWADLAQVRQVEVRVGVLGHLRATVGHQKSWKKCRSPIEKLLVAFRGVYYFTGFNNDPVDTFKRCPRRYPRYPCHTIYCPHFSGSDASSVPAFEAVVSNVSCADKGRISVTVRFRAYFSRDSALNMAQCVQWPVHTTHVFTARRSVGSSWAWQSGWCNNEQTMLLLQQWAPKCLLDNG